MLNTRKETMIKQSLHGTWTLKPADKKVSAIKKELSVQFPGDIH